MTSTSLPIPFANECELIDRFDDELNGLMQRYASSVVYDVVLSKQSGWKKQMLDCVLHREVKLNTVNEVRQGMQDIFLRTMQGKLQSPEFLNGAEAIYRSVSCCDSPTYFQRDMIYAIDRQFDQALERSTPLLSQDEKVRLERIILYPDDKAPSAKTFQFWEPNLRMLAMQIEKHQRPESFVKVDISFIPVSEARDRCLDVERLDFGIYTAEDYGVYHNWGTREVLTVHYSKPEGVQELLCYWRELKHSRDSLTYEDLKRELEWSATEVS